MDWTCDQSTLPCLVYNYARKAFNFMMYQLKVFIPFFKHEYGKKIHCVFVE